MSHYLREVRQGGEIQILESGNPVARIVPLTESSDEHRQKLISSGLLHPRRHNPAMILDEVPLKLPVSISASLEEDRKDRL